MTEFIAHYRQFDKTEQSVAAHLINVSSICGRLTNKIGLADVGKLLGLLHDLGKYSSAFQKYIQSSTDLLNPDIDDDYVDSSMLKGKIDHSTAGSQWIWQKFSGNGEQAKLLCQILAVCLASHHGGMIDCLLPEGKNDFVRRITKSDESTHLQECLVSCDKTIIDRLEILAIRTFLQQFWARLAVIIAPDQNEELRLKAFRIGFFTRFLFSCLIDADRIDSADFEEPGRKKFRRSGDVNWQPAIDRLESKIATFQVRNDVDKIRTKISDECLKRADGPQNIYTLTVPTGGGKTYTSMRFALHHAKKHGLDHIYYVIPFTSIIEQNAQVIRDAIEKDDDAFPWVLEHHSNLEPERQTWQSKLSGENWDAPIIFTTMVQFLEVLFGGGTRGARRLHNLANSLIIFDEIQTLPVKCVHLFNNALQFLVDHSGSTAVLCTATQPLLSGVNEKYGALKIPQENELVSDTSELFRNLKRVNVVDKTQPGGWSEEELATFAAEQFNARGNCLVIVNTKQWARVLYERCSQIVGEKNVYHLSTSLCPAHRKKILTEVTRRISSDVQEPVLCISTQLIEAGVDVDFNVVIRFLAGLDSIAQAAGRCNRNGRHETSDVFVVNPAEEKISMLEDIKIGQEKAMRVLGEEEHEDFLSPAVMERYFKYYFFDRAKDMKYEVDAKQIGRTDNLLNLLSDNPNNIGRQRASVSLQQSFKTAGKVFQAIDAPTQAVIVPYGDGKNIIAELCAAHEPAQSFRLLKKAQKYSVNVFPNIWRKLEEAQAVHPVQQGKMIYYLDERYYSQEFGLSAEEVGTLDFQIV
ncbi:MAG: CRISPR-associated helicase Cas3' [Deltaproteobacteria bacterium]|nr:CRISPR-associated helicase Cas3' [Deltaproteobacteria bacterium]MBN2673416.1 CRISPR-associated helicase Cas3' [Deltaproteobacteria bacterium]